jgi:hypothetical protein
MRLRYLHALAQPSATWIARGAILIVGIVMLFSPLAAAQKTPPKSAPPSPTVAPAFSDNDALTVFDNLEATLESYNRKKFLAAFDAAKMPNFPAFRDQINHLFETYDSFTVTYHLAQTAMEGSNGVALADFGLDGTSNSEGMRDLRRQARLRLVVAWNGKEWRIVDLSPRAVFQ